MYKAFMSYSHAADDRLAPALQSALHRFGKPWYRLRIFSVFRDKASLSANPALWPAIEAALSQSEYFILLASPAAAQSPWVEREVRWWLDSRSTKQLLLVQTDGEIAWDQATGDFDWTRSTCVPPALRGTFESEPLYVDVRWVRGEDHLSLRHSRFRAAVLDIAATLHGKPKHDLDGEDVREYRHARRLAVSATVALAVLGIAAGVAAYVAYSQRQIAEQRAVEAERQSRLSRSRELAAAAVAELPADTDRGLLLAIEAARVMRTAEADEAIRTALLQSASSRSLMRGHEDAIRDAAFSSDGTRVLTAGMDGKAILWDAASGTALSEFGGHSMGVSRVAFSPDNLRIVTASYDGTARVWNVATREVLTTLSYENEAVTSIAFSPDGRYVATANGMTAVVWDSASGRRVSETHHGALVNDVAFSFDSAYVLTAAGDLLASTETEERSRDPTARVWEAATGRVVTNLRGHTGMIYDAAFSPKADLVVTASRDGTARVWAIPAGEQLAELSHDHSVNAVAFDPTGRFIATANFDGDARVWTPDGEMVAELRGHDGALIDLNFSPSGELVVAAGRDKTARVWSATTGELLLTLRGHTALVFRATFSPDSRWVLTASGDRTARVWGPIASSVTLRADDFPIEAAAFSHDGTRLVTGSQDATAYAWNTATGARTALGGHGGGVYAVAFSKDGTRALTAGGDGIIRAWHPDASVEKSRVHAFRGPVSSASFSNDGRLAAIAGTDGTASVWDVEGGRPVRDLKGDADAIDRIVFSSDATLAATVTADRAVQLWDVSTGRLILRSPRVDDGRVNASIAPDNRFLITTSQTSARVWNTKSGSLINDQHRHERYVTGASVSPDGSMLLTTGGDSVARLWQVETGKKAAELVGHTDPVTGGVFSPNGLFIVTWGTDRSVRLWERTGRLLGELGARSSVAQRVMFAPSGRSVAVIRGNIVQLISCDACVPPEELVALAQSRVSRELTREEREKYLHEQPQQP
jgi:WD40 repeat protein